MQLLAFVFLLIISLICSLTVKNPPYGQLKITGKHLTKLDGTPVQLRGMSLFWSQYTDPWSLDHGEKFYKNITMPKLKCSWNSNIVRAAMGVMFGGYLENPETEYEKVKTVIEAAIQNGLYVLVDWHDEHAQYDNHTKAAMEFFGNISAAYGGYPHIIYETFNEPVGVEWPEIKAYHEKIISVIRENDPDNVIVCGTPNWSSDVISPANDPITGSENVAYTFHFYAGSHGQPFRDNVTVAIDLGLPIFVTEYGVVPSSGNGPVNETESQLWWQFCDQNLLSYVNWGVYDKNESAAALIPNTTAEQVGDPRRWSYGGKFVNRMLWSKDQNLIC